MSEGGSEGTLSYFVPRRRGHAVVLFRINGAVVWKEDNFEASETCFWAHIVKVRFTSEKRDDLLFTFKDLEGEEKLLYEAWKSGASTQATKTWLASTAGRVEKIYPSLTSVIVFSQPDQGPD